MLPNRCRPPVAFIYGVPDDMARDRAQVLGGPQVLSDRGVHVRSWNHVPEEFRGIIIESLLFDWYAVAYVSVDAQGRALPHHRIVNREHLYEIERMRAAQLRALKSDRR
jgi:hypothetical protein